MEHGQNIFAKERGPAVMLTTDLRGTDALVNKAPLKEYRCPYCDILVFRGHLESGSIVQTVCPRDTCDRQRRHMGAARFVTFGEMT